MTSRTRRNLVGLLLILLPCSPHAADVTARSAVIISDGTRLHADVYSPDHATAPLPTIIMSHGWGGTAAMLRPQATEFAQAGYLVIAFDYRGWGESQSRVIRASGKDPDAAGGTDGLNPGAMRELREIVDPIDQASDIQNVIHWAMGESAVDGKRVGLWGTSFSGGLIVYVAARDPRIRALVSQVGYMGQPLASTPPAALEKSYSDATRRARGELGYPAPRSQEIGNLVGAPIREKFLQYAPIDDVARAKNCAMLFIAAEHEELFDNRQHPQLAFQRAADPKKYVVIPNIAHYGIYGEAREQSSRLAIDWFDHYLKQ